MASLAFDQLEKNIEAIKLLLPPLDPSGNYTDLQIIQVRAFLLLSHAEIEYYFETRCREILDAFKNSKNPISEPNIRHRLSLYLAIKNKEDYTPYTFILSGACMAYENIINANNGIKESNIYRLLWPIGIDMKHIPPVLLPDLDSYGTKRGAIAHNALNHVIPFTPDPKVEDVAVAQLLTNIKLLDFELDKLLL